MTRGEGDIVAHRYRLLEVIGQGGFGVVWKAYDSGSGSLVALKFLHHATEALDRRFAVEAQALSRINSPYCLRPIDFGQDHGADFLVTEFVDGLSLDDWLATPRSLLERKSVARGIAAGLVAAHREGVVHRDLKPANIIISASNGEPAIIDFGIAKLLGQHQPDITKTGEVLGTPGFMGPEQLRGRKEIGAPTDMYAFGALLYRMLEGRPPFVGDSAIATAMQHLTQPAPAVRQPDAIQLAPLVAQLLDKDPARRPTAAVAEAALGGRSIGAPTHARPRDSSAVLVAAILVGLCGLAAIVVYVVKSDEGPAPTATVQVSPSLSSLLKAPGQPEDAGTVPIATLGDMERDTKDDVSESTACAGLKPLSPGIQPLRTDGGDVWVRIPANYDAGKPLPVVIMFHDAMQSPRRALDGPHYGALNDDEQWLGIAPEGDPWSARDNWRDPALHALVLRQVAGAKERLCIDERRQFALGFGHGGLAALRFAREVPVTAIATFAYRTVKWSPSPEADGPTAPAANAPLLTISVTDDPIQPFIGGRGCTGTKQLSVAEFHTSLHEALGCAKPPAAGNAELGCRTVECAAPLKTCVVDGGRRWPTGESHEDAARIGRLVRGCGEDDPPEGIERLIWDFFVAAPPLDP